MKIKSNEINIIRLYEASVKDVWDAWTDLNQVDKWWGPRGFTITTHSKDLSVGGIWHYTMHGSDGVDYPNKTKYFEIEKYSLLVYDHGGNDEQAPLFWVKALFKESNGKTTLDMTMSFATAELATEIKKHIKQAGGDTTWDRLGEYLDKKITGKEKFIINRSFNVSMDVMFGMWTNAKHFTQWLPPTGATMEFIKADIKPGGSGFYCMKMNDSKMYGKIQYIEVKSPNKLIYTQQFSDENGHTIRYPMAPSWPETMLTTVILANEDDNQTRVTVTWEIFGKATDEELKTFVQAKTGMFQGWTGSFDKLEEYL